MRVQSDNSLAICPATANSASGGASAWPPGFRFHPTDEELILYYLKRKICKRRIKLNIIHETDVYKWDPEELPGQSILKTGDRQWFFFSPRDRKYPNAARSNRATRHGYWKATGKDRNITCNSRAVGVKKTLVFYRGRAPNGERTDWVMHEYTLDEQELNRCQNVQDYYALYKVYKKSGPGPKNGEQYGAPFKEEEWVEDDYVDVFQYLDQGVAAKELKQVTSSDNSRVNCDIQSSLDDLEEFMNRLADEPEVGEQQVAGVLTLPQVVEEETHSTLAEPLSREVVFYPSVKQCNVPASFDVTQSSTSQLQLYEAPEVTSAPDNFKHNSSEEDFLEIDDLLGPEPTIPNPVENLPFEEMNGLSEFDLYHDASLFFNDLGTVDQGVTHPNVNTLGNDGLLNYQLPPNDMVNQWSCQFQPDDMVVNQLNFQLQPNDILNQFNYQLESDDMLDQFVSDQTSCQLWLHDQRSEVAELNQGAHSLPTSGVAHESTNPPIKPNPGSNGEQSVGTTSRLSSALWSLVESIPTTPASAAENALVSRAFERMSSFSRARLNARRATVVDSNRVAVTRRASRNKGFIFFSVLGALCAILWVLIGTVRLWGRCISS